MNCSRWRARSSIVANTLVAAGRARRAATSSRAGVRQRRDRRQRVVELVADHADHLLPGRALPGAQLARQAAQQRTAGARGRCRRNAAAREVEDLLFVARARRRTGRRRRARSPRAAPRARPRASREADAFEPAAAVRQLARGEVAVDDVAAGLDQHHRDRRVLHHRVEQQLALEQVLALLPQHAPEPVVRATSRRVRRARSEPSEKRSRRRGTRPRCPTRRGTSR